MTDQTNPAQSTKLEFSSKDFTPEELGQEAPTKTEGENAEVKPSEKVAEKVTEKHKVKYNGEEKEMTIEELITNAQKGMNYDKVLSERDQLKNSPENAELKAFLKEQGFKDVSSYIKATKEKSYNERLEARVKELESEGALPDHAKKIAELELSNTQVKEPEADSLENAFTELFKEYPETEKFKELSEFPPEVQKAIEDGKNPVVAYAKFLADKEAKEKAVALTNLANLQRDTGSLGTAGDEVKVDPFLEGLFGKYKKG